MKVRCTFILLILVRKGIGGVEYDVSVVELMEIVKYKDGIQC